MIDTAKLADNFACIRKRLSDAAQRAGRHPSEIRLIAVSKFVPTAGIAAAQALGQSLFGENYVQEARIKSSELQAQGINVEFHFIGHLQRNKAKDAVGFFSLIHTLDSMRLAEALDSAAEKKGLKQAVLIQVNISKEQSKSGLATAELETLVERVQALPNLSLRGLMCIGRYAEETAPRSDRVAEFVEMCALREHLQQQFGVMLPELSMGMSHDFELAIEYGATLVRVGTALFGARQTFKEGI